MQNWWSVICRRALANAALHGWPAVTTVPLAAVDAGTNFSRSALISLMHFQPEPVVDAVPSMHCDLLDLAQPCILNYLWNVVFIPTESEPTCCLLPGCYPGNHSKPLTSVAFLNMVFTHECMEPIHKHRELALNFKWRDEFLELQLSAASPSLLLMLRCQPCRILPQLCTAGNLAGFIFRIW